jgi:Ca2+-binding RTX toxin-like protein
MSSIAGTNSDDALRGVAGENNNIAGNGGNDTLAGRGKSDLVLGGQGNDVVKGANGHDTLFGGSGDDTLNGGNGADWLSGDRGNDILIGGNGNDTFAFNGNTADGVDTVKDFQNGTQSLNDKGKVFFQDKVELTNFAGADFAYLDNAGDAELWANGVLIAIFENASARDVLLATEFSGFSPGSVLLNGANTINIAGDDADNVLVGVPGIGNVIAGKDGNDELYGHGKSDSLLGGQGNDVLEGRNAADTLNGGGGDDTLNGGSGGDLLNGDVGFDTLTGGSGADTFQFTRGHAGSDTVTDFEAGVDLIEIRNDQVTDVLGLDQDGVDVDMFLNDNLIATFDNASVADIRNAVVNFNGTYDIIV